MISPAGIGLALFVCCSNTVYYMPVFGDPPGRQCIQGFKLAVIHVRICFRPDRCSS